MRLDATDLRYVTQDEFRVLTATEIGSKNHEVVPSSLIAEISGVRGGNVNKALGSLAKRGLVARVQNQKYDGFRLTYGGLDYLALRTFSRRKPPSVASVGKKIGVGKESDIYVVKDETGESRILKLHRLGRISFRAIKNKRDYLGNRSSASWMYMSRLGAEKEFAFMKALYLNDFPVPVPIDQARHCIVMSLVDSYPLRQINDVTSPSELYAKLMDLILRLAHVGLIHGDFNEFNILIKRKDGEPVVIDFPQMVSIRHENAEYFFNRDVNCIRKFFRKRFRYEAATWPVWKDVLAGLDLSEGQSGPSKQPAIPEAGEAEEAGNGNEVLAEVTGEAAGPAAEGSTSRTRPIRLDLEVEASGFSRALQTQLEDYMNQVQDMPESDYEDDGEDEDEGEEEEKEEEGRAEQGEEDVKAAGHPNGDEPFDEEAFQKQMSDRLEALRLHKALGNDDDPDNDPSLAPDEGEESDEEEDSDDDSADSDGPPQSDFTAYTRPPPSHAPRLNVRQPKDDSLRRSIAGKVMKEREASVRGGKGGTGGKTGGLGKRKGQKWKSSAAYAVGKNGGGDGWS